jgi:ComEC/Rec2-related protein
VTGIAAGAACLAGVSFGWWAAVAICLGYAAYIVAVPGRSLVVTHVVVLVAAAVGAWRAETTGTMPVARVAEISDRTVAIITAPVRTGREQYFVARFQSSESASNPGIADNICVTAGREPVVNFGDRVRLQGKSQSVGDLEFSQRTLLLSRGCGFRWYASYMEVVGSSPDQARLLPSLQSKLNFALRHAAPGDAGVLLSGLVTGDDSGFSPELQAALARSGTSHLTAVSGSNLALITGMLAAIGTATVGRYRIAWQVLMIVGVWAYALISGAHSPSIRAALVATAAVLAFRFGRKPDFATLILVAAGLMVVLDPKQADTLGFQLSVAASLGLALVVPSMLDGGRLSGAAVVVAATVTAQIATLPILLPVFGTISWTTVLANVLIAPLVAIAMPLAAFAGVTGLLSQPVGEIAAAPAIFIAEIALRVIDGLGGATASVRVGAPPRSAAIVFALVAAALLTLLSSGGIRLVGRVTNGDMTRAIELVPSPCQLDSTPRNSGLTLLVPAAAWVVAGKDPTYALGADTDDAVHKPSSQEEGHQVADEGQSAEAVTR